MNMTISAVTFVTAMAATPALAELTKVNSASAFKSIVDGKTLSRPLIKLRVGTNGSISGKGAKWPVTGSWTWKGGYFCRSLEWGGDDLGYNCQEVKASADKIRFTSDQGSGQTVVFNLQ